MKVNLPVRSVLLSLILGPTDSSRLNFLSLDAPQQYNTPRCSFSPQKLFCSPVDIPGFFLTNSHKTDYFIDKEEKKSRLAGYAYSLDSHSLDSTNSPGGTHIMLTH
jgi:hypothetical protein